jgi:hypothetical protein
MRYRFSNINDWHLELAQESTSFTLGDSLYRTPNASQNLFGFQFNVAAQSD